MRKRKEEILSTSLYAKQNNEQLGTVVISNYHKTYCLKKVIVFCSQCCGIREKLRQFLCRGLSCYCLQMCTAAASTRLQSSFAGLGMQGGSSTWLATDAGCLLGAQLGPSNKLPMHGFPTMATSGNWTSYMTAASLKASIPRNSGTCI